MEVTNVHNLTTVPDYLHYQSRKHPGREAIVFAHTDGSRTAVTFGQLYEKSRTLAKSFISLGVQKSDIIAITLQKCPEWLYATFGAIIAGARPMSLSFTYADGSDVVAMMKKLETCSAIVLDPNSDNATWEIFQKLVSHFDKEGHLRSELMPYLKFLICREKFPNNGSLLTMEDMIGWTNTGISLPKLEQDDIAVLFQTSGSTGLPKACTHTHKSIIASAKTLAGIMSLAEKEVFFNERPFSWSGGFPWTVMTGVTRVTTIGYCDPPNDTVGYLFDIIKREKCTSMVALPPLLNSLLNRQEEVDDSWPLQSLGTTGQPVSKKFAECLGKLCQKFMCVYGTTEFVVPCGLEVENPEDFKEYSIGYPFTGIQMKVVDKNEQSLPPNERGEIYVKCESMFKCYYNDPEKTKASLTEDGWFRTDDIGFVSEDGLFFCEGRKSEIIISGGMNVAPAILEAVLKSFPGVSNVTCVPVAHDVMYQVICACVMLEEGSGVTELQLRDYCEETHNDKPGLFTVLPTYYLFLEKFPETYSGKISRKELTRMAAERFLHVSV